MTRCPKCGHVRQTEESECSRCGTEFAYIAEKMARMAAEEAEQEKHLESLRRQLTKAGEEMAADQLQALLEYADELLGKQKRRHERVPCLMTAEFLIENRVHRDYVRDISPGGAFIETDDPVRVGEEIVITLSFSHHHRPFKISGTVTHAAQKGIGVQFQIASQVQEELIRGLVDKAAEFAP